MTPRWRCYACAPAGRLVLEPVCACGALSPWAREQAERVEVGLAVKPPCADCGAPLDRTSVLCPRCAKDRHNRAMRDGAHDTCTCGERKHKDSVMCWQCRGTQVAATRAQRAARRAAASNHCATPGCTGSPPPSPTKRSKYCAGCQQERRARRLKPLDVRI